MFPGGAIYNAHVGVSGGSENSQYAISLDYFNEEGVVPEKMESYILTNEEKSENKNILNEGSLERFDKKKKKRKRK